MAQAILLASTVVGVALLAVVAAFTSGRRRRALPVVQRSDGDEGLSAAAVRASHSPTAWVVAFAVGTCTLGGAAVLFVSGTGVPAGVRTAAGLVFGVGLAAVAGFYLFYGTVVTARGRGLDNAQAVALGSWLLGMALVAAVVAKLLGAL